MATHIYPSGKCCLGPNCNHPTGELRPTHTCPKCNEIVHLQCGRTCSLTDKVICLACCDTDDDGCKDSSSGTVTLLSQQLPESDNGNTAILNTEINVTTAPMEEFTTITDSVKSVSNKVIPKDYFITKNQRVNKQMKEIDDEWEGLKYRVQSMIDSELKGRMLKEALAAGLTYGKEDKEFRVEKFTEIGKSWKLDGSVENAKKINRIVSGIFESSRGYEYYIETEIMNKLKLAYKKDMHGRGCIACMVSRRRADLAKNVMKRSALTHDSKVVKKRTSEQTAEEGLRENKRAKHAFMIKKNQDSVWYNEDGSEYDGKKCAVQVTSSELELRKKIEDLQNQLAESVQVFIFVSFCFIYFLP